MGRYKLCIPHHLKIYIMTLKKGLKDQKLKKKEDF